MRDLKITKDAFVKTVAQNRHMSIADTEALADGSSMLGAAALQKHLIDQIGGYDEAKEYLAKATGVSADVCW